MSHVTNALYTTYIVTLLQVLFLNELEDILELLMDEQLQQVQTALFTLLAQCLGSQHFQVCLMHIHTILYTILATAYRSYLHNQQHTVAPAFCAIVWQSDLT
jgi:Protein phosphatase 2A regulatory B subunit (B56 family)